VRLASLKTSELHRVELPNDHLREFAFQTLLIHLCSTRRHGRTNDTALYMWRSNVLRVRKCSSYASFRNGLIARRLSSGPSTPISEKEFEGALGEVLPWAWENESKTPLGRGRVWRVGARTD
jgi:hypothetical protein